MSEIKVIGLFLASVLGIKVSLFPGAPDRSAASKQIAKASETICQHPHLTRRVFEKETNK